jgi:hypothetical protein
MKKLFVVAVGGMLATAAGIALVGQAQAAPAMDPNCKMGYVTGNSYAVSQSWADHYNCWHGTPAKPVAMRVPAGPAKDPMCKMGYVTGNSYAIAQSWADHYHCW